MEIDLQKHYHTRLNVTEMVENEKMTMNDQMTRGRKLSQNNYHSASARHFSRK